MRHTGNSGPANGAVEIVLRPSVAAILGLRSQLGHHRLPCEIPARLGTCMADPVDYTQNAGDSATLEWAFYL